MSFDDTLRAVIVCVDYSDILQFTLEYNKHHFDNICVITAPHDTKTQALVEEKDYPLFITDLFYRDNAVFNKFRALEAGLDLFGRYGWIALLDADVLWPKVAPLEQVLQVGRLCSPLRRMYTDFKVPFSIPDESIWRKYPVHRNVAEWAGYSQIFHASDSVLPKGNWHDTTWAHAGGADSFFQAMWHPNKKVRPSWEVLHIGPAGENWYGRASKDIITGEVPADAVKKYNDYMNIWTERRQRKAAGLDPFTPEKIKTLREPK